MRKIIIDTDCGLDDAMAIMLALNADDVEIVAITCVAGNTYVDNVIRNVFVTLDACNKTEIPVYKGASLPLLGKYAGPCEFHGQDGFGDIGDHPTPNKEIEKEHAAQILVQLAQSYPGEITLIMLGPLTNASLALRISSSFANNIKDLFIMGGNVEGLGNTSVSAEANFYTDPEAAFIVLEEMKCPISIVPWELCLKHFISWDCRENLLSSNTSRARLIGLIESSVFEKSTDYSGYILCDQFIMAVALNSKIVQKKSSPIYATVELNGRHTRGQMLIDVQNKLKKMPNIVVIENIDMDLFTDMLSKALSVM